MSDKISNFGRHIVVAIKNAPRYQRCLQRQCGEETQKTMFFVIGEASDPSEVLKFYRRHNKQCRSKKHRRRSRFRCHPIPMKEEKT